LLGKGELPVGLIPFFSEVWGIIQLTEAYKKTKVVASCKVKSRCHFGDLEFQQSCLGGQTALDAIIINFQITTLFRVNSDF
jgi:hypothetical protein